MILLLYPYLMGLSKHFPLWEAGLSVYMCEALAPTNWLNFLSVKLGSFRSRAYNLNAEPTYDIVLINSENINWYLRTSSILVAQYNIPVKILIAWILMQFVLLVFLHQPIFFILGLHWDAARRWKGDGICCNIINLFYNKIINLTNKLPRFHIAVNKLIVWENTLVSIVRCSITRCRTCQCS